jgi:CHAD domain-containing protein
VHQARVATRRLREAVPVAAAGLKGVKPRRLLRDLRTVTKALGPARDCDVTLTALQDVDTRSDRALGGVLRAITAHVRAERREATGPLDVALDATAMAELGRRLATLASVRAASTDTTCQAELARRLDDRARRLRQRIEKAGALFVPERLHDVRIAGKQLRYMLEIANECGFVSAARLLSTLKRTQDTLGRMQDLDVLLTRLRDMPDDTALESPRAAAVERLAVMFELERRTLHATYLRRRASLVHLADHVRDAVVPRVSDVPAVPSASEPTP